MWTLELSIKFQSFYNIRRRPLFCMFSHKRDIFYTSAENSTLGSLRNFRKISLTPLVDTEERRRRHLPCLLLEVSPNTAAAPRSTCGLLWCCDNPARTCTLNLSSYVIITHDTSTPHHSLRQPGLYCLHRIQILVFYHSPVRSESISC